MILLQQLLSILYMIKVRAEIDDFATTTAINTLQDKKVRAEINDIIDIIEPIQMILIK